MLLDDLSECYRLLKLPNASNWSILFKAVIKGSQAAEYKNNLVSGCALESL